MGSSFSNICSLKPVKGNQSIVRVTTADHDCVRVRFAASISCHHWHLPRFVMQQLFLKWNPEKVQRFFAHRWTDRGCCSCSVIARCYCNFANRLWGKSDISTLPNSKKNPNVRMLRQIEEIKELWIFSTFFQQMRPCHCWLAKPNASLFWKTVWDFLDAKFQNVLHSEDFPLNSCVTLIIVEKCHTV